MSLFHRTGFRARIAGDRARTRSSAGTLVRGGATVVTPAGRGATTDGSTAGRSGPTDSSTAGCGGATDDGTIGRRGATGGGTANDPVADLASASAADAFEFVVALGAALHRHGAPAYRLEPCLERVAARYGVALSVSIEPTALHLSPVDHAANPGLATRFLRLSPGADDLGSLADLDGLATDVLTGREGVAGAHERLRAILSAARPHPVLLELFAFVLVSLTAARFFDLGTIDLVAAGFAGAFVGLLSRFADRLPGPVPPAVVEGVAAASVTVAVAGAGIVVGVPISDLVVLAGLIVLVPGLRLTTAVSELATGHLASGVARIASAAVSFGALGYGVVAGRQIATALGLVMNAPAPGSSLPEWTWWLALAAAPWGFAVILRAARRDVLAIAVVAPTALVAARYGALFVGAELSGLVGAFTVTALSHGLARVRARPASVTLVPGFLLLVPGSLGFQGLAALLVEDVVTGVGSLARMLTVAMSLVAGMLLAACVVAPRRTL